MTVLDDAALRLRDAGVDSPRTEARLLLAHAMGVSKEDIISGARPDDAALARFRAAIERRSAREPFAYIVGRREFFSLDFVVGPGVLIPRPDSEMLIEDALRRFPRADETLRVLDLGTGSGCLLLAFLSERPNAEGVGIDRPELALGFARRNAERLGLAERARFLRGNWGESLNARFDLIFVNPPYVKSSNIPPNAILQIHVQKHFLGPQTRALVNNLKIPRVVSSTSPTKSGTASGAFDGPFRTPTAAATLHDPSGAEPSRSAARCTIVFFGLPVSVAPGQP